MTSRRKNQIIQLLLDSDQYIPAQILAAKLKVSEKTIYRDIKEIETMIHSDKPLIEKVSSKGYRINYSIFLKEKHKFSFIESNSISEVDRRDQILLELLYKTPKPTSISKLAEKFYISNSSIVNDLKCIEKELKKYELVLEKTSNGTFIFGTEKNIRKMLVSMTQRYLPFESKWILKPENDKVNDENIHLFLKRFSNEDIRFIQKIMNIIENRLEFDLENPYYINLFSHLLILIKRVKEGAFINEDSSIEKTTINLEMMKIALEVIQQIEKYLQEKFIFNEVEYIYMYLCSAGGQTYRVQKDNKKTEQTLVGNMVDQLIISIKKKLSIDLSKNAELRKQLIQHFNPLLKRVMYEVQVRNKLLEDIENEFGDLFKSIKSIMKGICLEYQLPRIIDDEIGYIVLYIQNAIEKEEQSKKVLIVCSTGIGTSHLLKTRVAKFFPKWTIVDVISAKEVKKYESNHSIDIVISTVKIESLKFKTVIVSSLFNEKDKEVVLNELSK